MKTLLALVFVLIMNDLNAQGLKFNDESYSKIPQKQSNIPISDDGLPQRIDLSMYVPTVIDQKQFGTCVGVSTAYYMRTILEAHKRGISDKKSIDALRFSPSYIYNVIKNPKDATCMDGSEIADALAHLKSHGSLTLAQQGYPSCTNNPALQPNADSKILDYVRVFGLINQRESSVLSTKKALAEMTPVVVGIQTTPSIDDLYHKLKPKLGFWAKLWQTILGFFRKESKEVTDSLWKPSKSKALRSGHAICIVGYDNAQFGGAFKAVNSRGENWGDKGYFWITYTDFTDHAKYGFQAYLSDNDLSGKSNLSASIVFTKATTTTENEIVAGLNTASQTDKIVTYTLSDSMPTNSQFKCEIDIDKQTYIYLLNAAANNIYATQIFPMADSVSAIVGANTKVVLPSKDSLYRLEGDPGVEYMLFLFSKTPINNLTDYINRINDGRGNFKSRVLAAFGTALVPFDEIKYRTKKMGFSLQERPHGYIVPILVTLNHVPPSRRLTTHL
jgi:Domain of unknown function (DUF4384)/Papain family cysteine protease